MRDLNWKLVAERVLENLSSLVSFLLTLIKRRKRKETLVKKEFSWERERGAKERFDVNGLRTKQRAMSMTKMEIFMRQSREWISDIR